MAGTSLAQPEAAASDHASAGSVVAKRSAIATRLLLPYYEVDTTDASGLTTSWAIRNESLLPIDLKVDYYEADAPQAPQRTEEYVVEGKEIVSRNLRDVPNLEVDPDGIRRGYVVLETVQKTPDLYGDYYLIDPGSAYAQGSLLVDISPGGTDEALCSIFSTRFLTGGPFNASTELVLWLDVDQIPEDLDLVTYSIYRSEGGEPLFVSTLPLDVATASFDVKQLFVPGLGLATGSIEFQLADGVRGHLAARINAEGQFSIGLEAMCKD